MSRWWRRGLLKLYPPRIRNRYGDELLDLQDELRDHGELSAGRLTRDVIRGAFLARSTRQRTLLLLSGALLAALVTTGVALRTGDAGHRAASPVAAVAIGVGTARPAMPYGQTCLIESGDSCTETACTTFAEQPTTNDQSAQLASPHRGSRAPGPCLGDTRVRPPHTLFVGSPQFVIGRAAQRRRATDTAQP